MRILPAFPACLVVALLAAPAAAQSSGLGSPTPETAPAPLTAPPAEEPAPAPGETTAPSSELPAVPAPSFAEPLPAIAACTDGRVSSGATHGRCCWPQQSFSVARARCEGSPQCPPGLTAHGDECIVHTPAPSFAPQEIGARQERPFRGDDLEPTTSIRHGLVGAGVTFLLTGYVAAATYGPILGSGCDASGLVWLAPIAGPLLGSGLQRCYYGYYGSTGADWFDWLMAGTTTAFQVAGLVMLIVGLADRRPIVIARNPEGTRRVTLDLAPTPTLRF